jgi:glycosyltransferase involved in cell wall biosynthesis
MKIVIAAWYLKDFNVGIGRYCRGLITALGRVDKDNEYHVLMPTATYRFPEFKNVHYHVIRFPLFKRRVWEQVAPQLVGRYDVLHFPHDSSVAWKRGKFVITIHDVKPLLFGTLRPRRGLNNFVERLLIPDRQEQADHVLTVSECSRRDITERLHFPKERVSVVYPGIDRNQFKPDFSMASQSIPRPYILCVVGSDPTKNVETLLDAFAQLPRELREGHDLVLVGDLRRRQDVRDRVDRLGIAAQTKFAGMVDDAQLVSLYQHARVFVFPSRYEGFGFPVLEAMACGCPVITSNAASLPEVVGDAALSADPSDSEGFARHLELVLVDEDLRRILREKGLDRAARFSWERTAQETLRVYERVIQA